MLKRILYFVILIFPLVSFERIICLRLSKRSIFPQGNPTRMQIIAGFGIPVDLQLESLTMGYVFKAQYFLPYNSSQLYQQDVTGIPIRIQRDNFKPRPKTLFGINQQIEDTSFWSQSNDRMKSSYDNKHSRWILYKSIETLLEINGLNGRQCMLRGICEVADKPFFYDGGLFGELLQIILSPSNTNEELLHHSDNEYFHAERSGRIGDPCGRVYNGCSTSLLDIITKSFLF